MGQPSFNQLMEFANRGRRAQEEVDNLVGPWTIGQEQVMNSIASSLRGINESLKEFVQLVSVELGDDEESDGQEG